MASDPPGSRLLELVAVMDRLRRECPWDQQQTHESLVRYLVEEAYEAIEAIEGKDPESMCEELGDLLLQVMFHARIASEAAASPFDIDDVASGIVDKLVARHPHVFAGVVVTDAAEVERNWEAIKAKEKSRKSVFDGIPLGMPALALADKVIRRRAIEVVEPVEFTAETTGDGSTTAEGSTTALTAEVVGDALFDLVAAASAAGIDAEQALRARVAREIDSVGTRPLRALPEPQQPPG